MAGGMLGLRTVTLDNHEVFLLARWNIHNFKITILSLINYLFVAKRMRILGMQIPNFCAQTWGPAVFTLCNMHLKLMHFGPNFACILGRFLVYIGLNLNAKYSGF